jgi:hypothetical protein
MSGGAIILGIALLIAVIVVVANIVERPSGRKQIIHEDKKDDFLVRLHHYEYRRRG